VRRESILLALLAGVCFGFFFILLDQIQSTALFSPLVFSRSVTVLCGLVLIAARGEGLPVPARHPLALLTGLCDAAGNTLYFLAIRYTRLDVATMLSSFYPATTVILASLLLHEKISRLQWLGILCCLAAVALIVG
jgi:drug/metabolite transporter (DMT)-like permease